MMPVPHAAAPHMPSLQIKRCAFAILVVFAARKKSTRSEGSIPLRDAIKLQNGPTILDSAQAALERCVRTGRRCYDRFLQCTLPKIIRSRLSRRIRCVFFNESGKCIYVCARCCRERAIKMSGKPDKERAPLPYDDLYRAPAPVNFIARGQVYGRPRHL